MVHAIDNLSHVPEAVLRHIWSRQFLRGQALATTGGKSVQVLHPGFINNDCGPDFRNALLVIGRTRYRGDIEFHRTLDDWFAHGHARDPKYNTLILHVVMECACHAAPTIVEAGREVPLLALKPYLSAPLEKIVEHMEREEFQIRRSPIACAATNDRIPAELLRKSLEEYGIERLRGKSRRMAHRLSEITCEISSGTFSQPYSPDDEIAMSRTVPNACLERGPLNNAAAWDQLLAEGILDGLGYSRNRDPFRRLSRIVSIAAIRRLKIGSILGIEAALFHVSGLLPDAGTLAHPPARAHAHILAETRTAMSAGYMEQIHRTEWTLSPARPSNLPTLRIAAAARLLAAITFGGLMEKMLRASEEMNTAPEILASQLLQALEVKADPFWSYHYSFAESVPSAHSILGVSRRRDIVMNTCIPLLLLYAEVFGRQQIHRNIAAAALAIGALEENAVTHKMEKQLLKNKVAVTHGIEQQGLLQLHNVYCMQKKCDVCRVSAAML